MPEAGAVLIVMYLSAVGHVAIEMKDYSSAKTCADAVRVITAMAVKASDEHFLVRRIKVQAACVAR